MSRNTVEKNGTITYIYDSNVGANSKKAIQQVFSNIFEKASKNQEIFNGLSINVFGNWEESYFADNISDGRMGFTKYPVADSGKNIYLQTNEYRDLNTSFMQNNKSNTNIIRETTAHEFGHFFDYYFANPDSDITEQLREMYKFGKKYINENNEKYNELLEIYRKTNGLSDSEDFIEAWRMDVENEFQGKSKSEILRKTLKLGYFSPNNIHNDHITNIRIKLEDGIDDGEIILADRAREEVFAQLFAYAMGEGNNKKEKELIITTYPKCYNVVKKYINEFLGINITENSSQDGLDITM